MCACESDIELKSEIESSKQGNRVGHFIINFKLAMYALINSNICI